MDNNSMEDKNNWLTDETIRIIVERKVLMMKRLGGTAVYRKLCALIQKAAGKNRIIISMRHVRELPNSGTEMRLDACLML